MQKHHFREASVSGIPVVAHIRHVETHYDTLLAMGRERWEAREKVIDKVQMTLNEWQGKLSHSEECQ